MNILLDIEYNETHLSGEKRVASACILKRLFFFYVMLNTTEHPFEQLKALVIF